MKYVRYLNSFISMHNEAFENACCFPLEQIQLNNGLEIKEEVEYNRFFQWYLWMMLVLFDFSKLFEMLVMPSQLVLKINYYNSGFIPNVLIYTLDSNLKITIEVKSNLPDFLNE